MSYSPASLALAYDESCALIRQLRGSDPLRDVALAERPNHAAGMAQGWRDAAALYLDLSKGWQSLGDVRRAKLMARAYGRCELYASRFERWLEEHAAGRIA